MSARRALALACVWLLTAAASALPAHAIDGEILIDQAAVEAGGLTPGDAPGFPATLSRRGKYKLRDNLSVPSGQIGLEVTADDVTVDLNGFSIRSAPAGAASYGVFAEGASLTVKNGAISDFNGAGVYNPSGAFAIVEDVRLRGNGEAVVLGRGGRVLGSTISDNGFGPVCDAECLFQGNVVTGNDDGFGNGWGIALAARSLALGNLIVSNRSFGIVFRFVGVGGATGYGDNTILGNNGGGAQVSLSGGQLTPLHPNACSPACP